LATLSNAPIKQLAAVIRDERAATLQRTHAMWAVRRIVLGDARPDRLTKAQAETIEKQLFPVTKSSLAFPVEDPGWHSENPLIRAQAVRALFFWNAHSEGGEAFLKVMNPSSDVSPLVRLNHASQLGAFPLEPGADPGSNPGFFLRELFVDPDPFVRFAARAAVRRAGDWTFMVELFRNLRNPERRHAETRIGGKDIPFDRSLYEQECWLALKGFYVETAVQHLTSQMELMSAKERANTANALGGLAYQPLPWDGRWWGTQPVKSPPPLNSVAWAGTPKALASRAFRVR
jgi:hypothetical protein